MNFTSFNFLLFVILVTIVYYMVPTKIRWLFLLISGYWFYSFSGITGVIFLASVTFISWLGALLVSICENKSKSLRRFIFVTDLLICLGILAVTKYTSIMGELIPVAISFYVFMSASYLIDVYKGTVKAEKNLLKYASYAGFYPLLSQGPIVRYKELSDQLFTPKKFTSDNFSHGILRIAYGFFLKLMIADRLGIITDTLTADPTTYNGAWYAVVLVLYTLRLYTDFSGGINVTIGAAKLIGIELPENFSQPLFSVSIADFWRRWHITMGSWFRDYIYIPLGGNRVSKVRVYFNLLAVWIATGIWHGKGPNFIVWGLLNFLVLAGSRALTKPFKAFRSKLHLENNIIYRIFQSLRTYIFAATFFTLFCYETLKDAYNGFVSMFTVKNWNVLTDGSLLTLGLDKSDYIIVAVSLFLVFTIGIIREKKWTAKFYALPYYIKYSALLILIYATLIFGTYGMGYDASSFIYNRF